MNMFLSELVLTGRRYYEPNSYLNDLLVLSYNFELITQPAITCSKSTVETLEQYVKYVQS